MAKSKSTRYSVSGRKPGKRKAESILLHEMKSNVSVRSIAVGFGGSGAGQAYEVENLQGLTGQTWTMRILALSSGDLCVAVEKNNPKHTPGFDQYYYFNRRGKLWGIEDRDGFSSIQPPANRSEPTGKYARLSEGRAKRRRRGIAIRTNSGTATRVSH